nr:TRAP transporter small permease [Pseudomonas sp.]
LMLIGMVMLTCYVVLMRSAFSSPPFWGDTVVMIANIWFVMLAFALSIRERSSIAMQMVYSRLPLVVVRCLSALWSLLFLGVGVIMLIHGYRIASRVPGAYWELGNLPKAVPMMILPVAGALIIAACLAVLLEDATGRTPPFDDSSSAL